jgi:hypothetical protein
MSASMVATAPGRRRRQPDRRADFTRAAQHGLFAFFPVFATLFMLGFEIRA